MILQKSNLWDHNLKFSKLIFVHQKFQFENFRFSIVQNKVLSQMHYFKNGSNIDWDWSSDPFLTYWTKICVKSILKTQNQLLSELLYYNANTHCQFFITLSKCLTIVLMIFIKIWPSYMRINCWNRMGYPKLVYLKSVI